MTEPATISSCLPSTRCSPTRGGFQTRRARLLPSQRRGKLRLGGSPPSRITVLKRLQRAVVSILHKTRSASEEIRPGRVYRRRPPRLRFGFSPQLSARAGPYRSRRRIRKPQPANSHRLLAGSGTAIAQIPRLCLKTPLSSGERLGEGLNLRATRPSPNLSLIGRGTFETKPSCPVMTSPFRALCVTLGAGRHLRLAQAGSLPYAARRPAVGWPPDAPFQCPTAGDETK